MMGHDGTCLLLQAGTCADLKRTLAAVFPKEPRNFSTCHWHEGFGVVRPATAHKEQRQIEQQPPRAGPECNARQDPHPIYTVV